MSFEEVMRLPIRAFWLMDRNIPRIQATEDMRALEVSTSTQSSEGFTAHRDKLLKETGEVFKGNLIVYDDTRDEAGFEELRLMAM